MGSPLPVAVALAAAFVTTSTGCAVTVVPDGTVRHVGRASRAALSPEHISVLVWNVYKSSLDGWWDDFEQIVPSYDLLLLQEGSWDAASEARYASLGRDWWMGVTFVSNWVEGDPATGTVIGSVAPHHGVACRHSRYLEPVLGTPKSHTFGRLPLEGRDEDLFVSSVHGINFRPDEAPFVAHLTDVMADVAGHEGPAIVAGDFNTWSAWRMDQLFEIMTERGFTAVYPRAPSDGRGDGRATASGHYLDHAFVRGLEVLDRPRVLTEVRSSDHQALAFVVRAP